MRRSTPVPTLSVPELGRDVDVRALARHEAVRLFVDRASVGAARVRARLTDANAAAVARDLPASSTASRWRIELAAARTRALSVQAIASRLSDRFRLLVSGDQTVLPRQRTLRALIDWSFDLLSDGRARACSAACRCLPAAGRWKPPKRWAAATGSTAAEVLDLLAQLVAKSLVVMDLGGDRYRMLETVQRAYAAEKLAGAPRLGDEAEHPRGRHVAHHLALAEVRPGTHLAGPGARA